MSRRGWPTLGRSPTSRWRSPLPEGWRDDAPVGALEAAATLPRMPRRVLAAVSSTSLGALQAAVLGTVQGLTEFVPVSSSAHLVIVPFLLGWPVPDLAFDAAVHLGTALAVGGYFAGEPPRGVGPGATG